MTIWENRGIIAQLQLEPMSNMLWTHFCAVNGCLFPSTANQLAGRG